MDNFTSDLNVSMHKKRKMNVAENLFSIYHERQQSQSSQDMPQFYEVIYEDTSFQNKLDNRKQKPAKKTKFEQVENKIHKG